jgi:hypothetical protein
MINKHKKVWKVISRKVNYGKNNCLHFVFSGCVRSLEVCPAPFAFFFLPEVKIQYHEQKPRKPEGTKRLKID